MIRFIHFQCIVTWDPIKIFQHMPNLFMNFLFIWKFSSSNVHFWKLWSYKVLMSIKSLNWCFTLWCMIKQKWVHFQLHNELQVPENHVTSCLLVSSSHEPNKGFRAYFWSIFVACLFNTSVNYSNPFRKIACNVFSNSTLVLLMANHERLSNRNFWYFGHDSVWMGQTSGSGEMLTFWVDYSTWLPCFLIGILIHNGYILFNKTLMLTKCWMLIARVSVVAHRHFMFCFTSQIQCDINKFVKSLKLNGQILKLVNCSVLCFF